MCSTTSCCSRCCSSARRSGQDVKIIKDLGLSATSLFGLFISIFVGINLVSKEVERRSVYPLFAKPIRRSEFVVGKYAGDEFELAKRSQERMWRVEAILALGRLRERLSA